MVKDEILLAKVSAVRHCLRRVRDKLPDKAQDLADDADLRDVVIHNLWQAIQGCIDIAAHVVSDDGLGQPDSMAGMFEVLVDNAVLEAGLGNRLRRAVGLRNLIVHQYARLDLPLVHRLAPDGCADLEAFLVRILEYAGVLVTGENGGPRTGGP